MIDFSTIESTLTDLDSIYNTANDGNLQIYCSKLAVIEFGGWIEETIDDIARQYIFNKHISNYDVDKFIRNKINGTYGFKFDVLSNLLCLTLGVKLWNNLLNDLDQRGYSEQFKNILNNSAQKRNDAAHKNISQMTTYEAPSTILNNFKKIKPIMQHIDKYVGTL